MPLSILSKLWAVEPSWMARGAESSCQDYADSGQCVLTPDGYLTSARLGHEGGLARGYSTQTYPFNHKAC